MEQQESDVEGFDTKILRRRLQADESKNSHKRKFERHSIFAVGTMTIMDNSQLIDGVVDEVSVGGMRFHPASNYIMERNEEAVFMKIGDIKISGRIRASRADGYGVQLLDLLTEEQLQQIIEQYKI